MPWITALLAAAAVALLCAGPAHAAWYPGSVIDGPNSDIVEVDGVDLSLDGTGGAVYIKKDGGVNHVFVSQFFLGAFGPAQRVDPGLNSPSSSARIAASEDGRLAVVFVNNGSLYGVVAGDKTQPFTTPAVIEQGTNANPVSTPSLALSVHGVGYVAYTVAGGGGADVKVARLPINGTSWSGIPGTLDLDASHTAGVGDGRPSIAVAADGTALAAWGESGGVPMRRIGRTGISKAAIGASDTDLDGHAPGFADSPQVALNDDSSYGEVVLRQNFDNGNGSPVSRLIGRHLVAGDLGPAQAIDGMDFPTPEGAHNPTLAMDLRGRGIGGGSRDLSLTPTAALLRDDFAGGQLLGQLTNGGVDPQTTVGTGQNLTGVVAWMQSPTPPPDGVVAAGRFAINNAYEDEAQLSPPDYGPVLEKGGIFASSARTGDSVVVFTQGPPTARRVVGAVYDRFPGRANLRTPRVVHTQEPLLRWLPASDLFGQPTYTVYLDGNNIGETQGTTMRVPNPLSEGKHSWRVDTTDIHGQKRPGRKRDLRIKTTPTAA